MGTMPLQFKECLFFLASNIIFPTRIVKSKNSAIAIGMEMILFATEDGGFTGGNAELNPS